MQVQVKQLISKAKKKDRSAQMDLYQHFKSYWYAICLRYNGNRFDADDCLQNGLINIFSKLDQFDVKRGDFKSWSAQVMVNDNLMFLRKKKNNFEAFDTEMDVEDVSTISEESNVISSENLTKLIQALPDGYRTVFNLYVLEGYTHNEIASILEISIGTSKSQLSKARKLLQHQLEVVI